MLVCIDCGQQRRCRDGLATGQPRCGSCRGRGRPRKLCASCNKERRIHSRLPLGNVCGSCHTKIRHRPAACAQCAERRPLIGLDASGQKVCGPCAGDAREWICTRCGRFDALFSDRQCPRCVVERRLRSLLSDQNGQVRPQLEPLLALLTTESDAYQVLLLLYRAEWLSLLGRLAREHEEITHAVLDDLPPRQHVHYLRRALMASGILPDRDEYLDSVPSWLEAMLAKQAPHIARLIRPYASWSVLRRARSRSQHHESTPSVRKYARARILIAINFLTWLDGCNLTLGTATQAHVDAWLDGGTTTHNRLRDFLLWAHSRRLAAELAVPWLGSREDPEEILTDDHRWQLLRQCLSNEEIPLQLRVAGSLVLLYGQVPQHIVRITRPQLTRKGAHTYLTLEQSPMLLPTPLADLFQRLSAEPVTSRSALHGLGMDSQLLFPGTGPGGGMDHGRLTLKLNQLGIRVRPARNGALCALASDLPAAVLADLLGIHITTAVRWVRLVKRDWTSYLASRDSSTQVGG
ncbi:hypothetical protein ACFP3U_21740 [Kitasatospora misakiensis]|uniref:Uncharacterized protein n=1 Tax=Kitasatospora misakiensis TaxID=67330 RepID=A0ABW0X767_9ACTN